MLPLRQMALTERDIEEGANHPSKVKKRKVRAQPHFHLSGVKTPGCSDCLAGTVPGMLGNAVSAHWSRRRWVRLILLWVLQDMDNFDFGTVACPGASFHLFAPWM